MSVMRARLHATPAVDAQPVLRATAALSRQPLSAYACSPASPARQSSAVYGCEIGGDAVTAVSSCDVSTGVCQKWHLEVLVVR